MGNLLAYSGIVTKVRAMQAKLLTDEDFQNIAAFHTVTEVAAYLHRSFHDRSLSAGWNRSCSDVRSTASSDRTERAADEQDQKENRKNGTKQSNVCHPGIL